MYYLRNGAVRYESVMKLREQLDKLGRMKGVAQDEKGALESCMYSCATLSRASSARYLYIYCLDPEEFLNMLFKHTLHVPAFITIQ